MKIWYGYGSEHSSNLVLIGKFKTSADAKKTQGLINELASRLTEEYNIDYPRERFPEDVGNTLRELNCYILSPSDLKSFLYDCRTDLDKNTLTLNTNDSDIGGLIKLMVDRGAKVEVYSAHDYPDESS